MKKRINKIVFVLILSVVLLTACGKTEGNSKDKKLVYTSFFPIYELTKSVGGEELEVKSFMPTNKEAHLWEPSPKDLRKLKKADLLIVNGANMERWLDQVKDVMPDLEVLVLSEGVDLITYKGAAAIGDFQYMAEYEADQNQIYKFDFGHTHQDLMRVTFIDNSDNKSIDELKKIGKEYMKKKGDLVKQKSTIDVKEGQVYALEMGHESGEIFYKLPKSGKWVVVSDRVSEELLSYSILDKNNGDVKLDVMLEGSTSSDDKLTYDPHSWMSIVNAKKYLNTIYSKLSEIKPESESVFKKNKVKMVSDLTELEFQFKDRFEALQKKEFVVTHNAYAYLARDFNLKQYPLQGLISTETPSMKTIKKAIGFSKDYGINTIFYEYKGQTKGAQTVADEIGGNLKPLASMEYATIQEEGEKNLYYELMKMNLTNLYDSMEDIK